VIRPFRLLASISIEDRQWRGSIEDLSVLGVAVILKQVPPELRPGLRVIVDLSTDLDPEPIQLQAEVIRLAEMRTSRVLVGLQFVDVDEGSSRELDAFLAVAKEAEALAD
jgi:c-di-GMP-binding flagellar brake protein YcgR